MQNKNLRPIRENQSLSENITLRRATQVMKILNESGNPCYFKGRGNGGVLVVIDNLKGGR